MTRSAAVPRHTVVVPGEPPLTIDADNWIVALGIALELCERSDALTRLACEVKKGGTVVATDGISGEVYTLVPGELPDFDDADVEPWSGDDEADEADEADVIVLGEV